MLPDAPPTVIPIRTVRHLARNPNFGGEVMVVSLGCEKLQPERLLPPGSLPIQVQAVEAQLRRALGTKVVVHANGKGAGRIVIPFTDLDEFQRILDHICE
jgi:altronate dehydratase